MTIHPRRLLGNGEFGEVWHAWDDALERDVAVKVIDPGKIGRPIGEMFAEAQALLQAQHGNVVQVHSASEVNGQPLIVMEYLPAGSLQDRYGGRPVPVREALDAVAQACRGLGHAHVRGLLHRDVKPGNLMVGDNELVKLSDFGLACSSRNVVAGPLIGYRPHLPPEAVDDGYIQDPLGDVYASGVTLYRLLNGDDMLFSAAKPGADLDALVKAGKFPRRDRWLPHVPAAVRRVVRRAMHLDPSKRPQDADRLRHDIEAGYPRVSFRCADPSDPIDGDWIGQDSIGQEWMVHIRERPRAGDHEVTVLKQLPGREFRRSGSDSGLFDTRAMAARHASRVMDRLSRLGG